MRTKLADSLPMSTLDSDELAKPIRPIANRLWSGRGVGIAAAGGVGAAFGAISGWWIPRGPVSTAEAAATVVIAGLVGIAAGFAMASRWAMVITPLAFVVVFELVRLGATGPTVDWVGVTTTYTAIAFVTGRVVHGLIALVPMVIGVEWGRRFAGRLGAPLPRRPGRVAFAVTILATALLCAGTVGLLRPATTAAIVGPDGDQMPGSIAELTTVEVNGHDQSLLIRGRSQDAPVLLYLAGGPGGTDMGAMRNDTSLEDDFIVVTWDQRGAGHSYASLEPASTLTVESLIDDTLSVTDYLRERFGEERVYLVGNSWGTTLGVLAAQRSPERFAAFVGAGQMVSQRATDIMFWEDTLAWAGSTGREGLAADLNRLGPPPYENIMDYEMAVLAHEHDWNRYPNLDLSLEMPAILFVPEYSWMDRFNAFRGFLDSGAVIYPQLQDVDFRVDVPRLEIPVTIVMGEHETRGRRVPAVEWYDMLDTPSKQMIVFEGTGHRPHIEDPGRFSEVMAGVLASASEGER